VTLWLVAVSLWIACGAKQPPRDTCRERLLGKYEAVSESEWTLSLALQADGSAELVHTAWIAGQSDDAEDKVLSPSWSCSGERVVVLMDDGPVTLEASDSLSFADFGADGSGRGLKSVESSSKLLLLGVSLWRSEDLRAVPEMQ